MIEKENLIIFKKPERGYFDPLAEFRAQCREMNALMPAQNDVPLHSITAVGALVEDGELSACDNLYFIKVLSECSLQGIPVDPDFTLTVVNMEYGQDFLNPDFHLSTDLLLSCYLFKPSVLFCSNDYGTFGVSREYIRDDGAWGKAAARNHAKVIIALGGKVEISGEDFLKGSSSYVDVTVPERGCAQSILVGVDVLIEQEWGRARGLVTQRAPEKVSIPDQRASKSKEPSFPMCDPINLEDDPFSKFLDKAFKTRLGQRGLERALHWAVEKYKK